MNLSKVDDKVYLFCIRGKHQRAQAVNTQSSRREFQISVIHKLGLVFPGTRFLLLGIRIDPDKPLGLEAGDVLLTGVLLGVFVAVDGLVLLEVRLVLDTAEEVEVGRTVLVTAADGGSLLMADGAEEVPAAGHGAEDLLQGAVHRLVDLAAPEGAGEVEPLVVPEGEQSAGLLLLLSGDSTQDAFSQVRLRGEFCWLTVVARQGFSLPAAVAVLGGRRLDNIISVRGLGVTRAGLPLTPVPGRLLRGEPGEHLLHQGEVVGPQLLPDRITVGRLQGSSFDDIGNIQMKIQNGRKSTALDKMLQFIEFNCIVVMVLFSNIL